MKKLCTTGLIIFMSGFSVLAGNIDKNKRPTILKREKFETANSRMLRAAKMESQMKVPNGVNFSNLPIFKKSKPSKTQSTASVSFIDLGVSINPYGTFLNGRNYVATNPALNTVALFRRGWQTDPNPDGGNNGNKLFYDINTQGGAEPGWQTGQGPVYTHTPYDTSTNNHGARYPQGVLYNPPGNTNAQNLIAFGNPRILDGTNDAWGGLGLGWKSVGPSLATKQRIWTTEEILHFRTESMEVTSLGDVFMVEPEEDLSGGGVVFTDKVHIYKYTYNAANNNFDSLVVPIPFENEGGDYGVGLGSASIAFAPDGITGFVALGAFNNAYDSIGAYIPYIAKTTDGGTTWSPFKRIQINLPYTNYTSPALDALRDQLFVSNFVHFTEAGEIVPAARGEEYSHKVDYTVNDIDLTVDAHGYAHILTNLSVSGFGDTLFSDPTNQTYYPGYGSWNIDLYIKDLADEPYGFLISSNSALNGLWGDPASTADQIVEGNRPQITRSADGTVIAFCWYDTDQDAHPQTGDNTNSNPDMWVQRIKLLGPGQIRMDSFPRNLTKASDYDGLIIQGSVAPFMLNSTQGYKIAATSVNLPPYPGTSAVWPTQHLFIDNIFVPSATDSFPITPTTYYPVVSNKGKIENQSGSNYISIAPNPGQGIFNLQFQNSSVGLIKILISDNLGRKVWSEEKISDVGLVNSKFNLTDYPSGLYQVSTILPDGKRLVHKILKN